MNFDKEYVLKMAELYGIEIGIGEGTPMVEENGICRELLSKDIEDIFMKNNSQSYDMEVFAKKSAFDLEVNKYVLGAA